MTSLPPKCRLYQRKSCGQSDGSPRVDGRFSEGVQAGFGRTTLALWRTSVLLEGGSPRAFCQNEVLAQWGPRVLGQEGQLPHPSALNHQEQHSQGPAWDQPAMPAEAHVSRTNGPTIHRSSRGHGGHRTGR